MQPMPMRLTSHHGGGMFWSSYPQQPWTLNPNDHKLFKYALLILLLLRLVQVVASSISLAVRRPFRVPALHGSMPQRTNGSTHSYVKMPKRTCKPRRACLSPGTLHGAAARAVQRHDQHVCVPLQGCPPSSWRFCSCSQWGLSHTHSSAARQRRAPPHSTSEQQSIRQRTPRNSRP